MNKFEKQLGKPQARKTSEVSNDEPSSTLKEPLSNKRAAVSHSGPSYGNRPNFSRQNRQYNSRGSARNYRPPNKKSREDLNYSYQNTPQANFFKR